MDREQALKDLIEYKNNRRKAIEKFRENNEKLYFAYINDVPKKR